MIVMRDFVVYVSLSPNPATWSHSDKDLGKPKFVVASFDWAPEEMVKLSQ